MTHVTNYWQPSISYMEHGMKSLGLKMTFNNPPKCISYPGNYKITYLLKCNPNGTGIILEVVKKISSCEFVYEFLTKYSCLNYAYNGDSSSNENGNNGVIITPINNTSMSYQSLLFWIFFIFLTYLLSFTIYNYRKNPEDGLIKSLPHREFWSAYFSNSLYGFKITYYFIKSKISS